MNDFRIENRGHDLNGVVASFRAILKRRKAAAVNRDVDVSGIGLQALADHPADLAMLDDTLVYEPDAGTENEVAFDLFPGELKFVLLRPNVFARPAERVAVVIRVVSGRAVVGDRANVAVTFEDSDWLHRAAYGRKNGTPIKDIRMARHVAKCAIIEWFPL